MSDTTNYWDIKATSLGTGEPTWAPDTQKHDLLPSNVLPVTTQSELAQKDAVMAIFANFEKEYRFDFQANEHGFHDNPKAHGFLWLDNEHSTDFMVVGACAFLLKPVRDEEVWFLRWAWFHPYERRKSHMSDTWKYFRETYGDFYVEPPYSRAMRNFLIKQEGNSNWGHLKKTH